MSNILSSKFFLGVMIVAVMVAGFAMFTISAQAAYIHTTTLKQGMSSAQVTSLQEALNMTSCKVGSGLATGFFGSMTKVAVMCFQSANSLSADGIVGPKTGATLGSDIVAITPCSAGALFNSMTGASCTAGSGSISAHGTPVNNANTNTGTGTNTHTNSTSASLTSVDGADNDLGVYVIKIKLTAFGDDMFISQSGSVAYTARIENASDSSVLTPTTVSTVISSTADTEGGSYRVNQDDTEEFTFTITANPDPADEGQSIRAQLLTIVSGTSAGTPTGNTFTVNADNLSKYRTAGVVIPD